MTKRSINPRKYFPGQLLNRKQYMNVFSVCWVWQASCNEVTRGILSRFKEDAVRYVDSILSHGTYRPYCPTPMDTSTPQERRFWRRKSKKTEDTDARKGRKVAKHCVFPMICGSGGSKNRLAKAAGAEPAGQRRDEKLHAVVARSTFPSENVQNIPLSDHCWKLRCQKSARRCGAKHISKSKCTKHRRSGPLLELAMSKKCTPLWREAHFQVKMYKTHQVRTTFGSCDVEKVNAVVARSTFPSQKCKKLRVLNLF